jgi:hypothetical protein
LTPAIMEVVPVLTWWAGFGAFMLALGARIPLVRRFIAWFVSQPFAAPGLTRDHLQHMKREMLRVPMAILSLMARFMVETRLRPEALDDVELIFGEKDPFSPLKAQNEAIRRFGGSFDRVHRMGSGGHYPHLLLKEHPEWAAHNQDEVVRLIGASLMASSQGGVPTTQAVVAAPSPVVVDLLPN